MGHHIIVSDLFSSDRINQSSTMFHQLRVHELRHHLATIMYPPVFTNVACGKIHQQNVRPEFPLKPP